MAAAEFARRSLGRTPGPDSLTSPLPRPLIRKSFRIQNTGNTGPGEVAEALQAVQESLRALGVAVSPGFAVAQVTKHFSR